MACVDQGRNNQDMCLDWHQISKDINRVLNFIPAHVCEFEVQDIFLAKGVKFVFQAACLVQLKTGADKITVKAVWKRTFCIIWTKPEVMLLVVWTAHHEKGWIIFVKNQT